MSLPLKGYRPRLAQKEYSHGDTRDPGSSSTCLEWSFCLGSRVAADTWSHSYTPASRKKRRQGDILMARLSHVAILSCRSPPELLPPQLAVILSIHTAKHPRSTLPFLLSIRIQLRLGLLKCPCDLCWTSHSHPWVFLSHFSSWLHQQIA